MNDRVVIGYELGDKTCQITYYKDDMEEPKTFSSVEDEARFPLIIGKSGDEWTYGVAAKQMVSLGEGYTVSKLLSRVRTNETIEIEEEEYDARSLLKQFIKLSLASFTNIEAIVFSLEESDVQMHAILEDSARALKISRRKFTVQTKKESFARYLFAQAKDLWQYNAVLFAYDGTSIEAYTFKRTLLEKKKPIFVTVEKVASITMKEISPAFPIMDERRAKYADEKFLDFVEGVFQKKVVTSVFLMGEVFNQDWYPDSLKRLCRQRRVFKGNNLFSRGACHTAMSYFESKEIQYVYMDESKLPARILLTTRVSGAEVEAPILHWGKAWYEAEQLSEILLREPEDLMISVEYLSGEREEYVIPIEGFPERKVYSYRLACRVGCKRENFVDIEIKDAGFGVFYAKTEFETSLSVKLKGGIDGQ